MAKRIKKRTKDMDEQLRLYLLSMIPKKKYITDNQNSGSILNQIEQPIILSSDFDKDEHQFSVERGTGMGAPGKAIIYLINALTQMFMENAKKYFKGDMTKVTDYMNSIQGPIEIFDLNDMSSVDPEMLQELYDLHDKAAAHSCKVNHEDLENVVKNLSEISTLIDNAEKQLKSGKLSKEQQKELKDKTIEKMQSSLNELEGKLLGKAKKEDAPEIDFEYMEKILKKHGPEAVAEELRRLPPEKRDELLAKLVTLKEFKPNNEK